MRKKMGVSHMYTQLYTVHVDELYTPQIALLMHEVNCKRGILYVQAIPRLFAVVVAFSAAAIERCNVRSERRM